MDPRSRKPALHLAKPPFAVFMQAMDRLIRHGLVIQAGTWKILNGPRSALHHLHASFTYSDLTAALALSNDPLQKFCT
jgi:hypothetical protein